MTAQRKLALSSGYTLLLMAVVAAFCFGFAFPIFYDTGDSGLFSKNIQANQMLYMVMLSTLVLIVVLDVIVSYTLMYFFNADSSRIAIQAYYLRMCYTAVFVVANYFLLINLKESDGQAAQLNYRLFATIWSAGLIIFGVHLLALGRLMKIHKKMPRYLWYLTFVAGVSYVLVHSLKLAMPAFESSTNTLNNILALPMALGELGLAVWFILKGGK